MTRRSILSFIIIVVLLFTVNYVTANSQIPQISIENVHVKAVKDAIIEDFIKKGWHIHSVNDYQIILKCDADIVASIFFGSRFNRRPEYRIQFDVIEVGSNVIVACNYKIVTNPGSAFETQTPVPSQYINPYLRALKRYFNGDIGYGFDVAPNKNLSSIVIVYVWVDSELEKAGIVAGDKIKAINGTSITKMKMKDIEAILQSGNEGDSIVLTIATKHEEKVITVIKRFYPRRYIQSNGLSES